MSEDQRQADKEEAIRDKIRADCVFVRGRGYVLKEELREENKEEEEQP